MRSIGLRRISPTTAGALTVLALLAGPPEARGDGRHLGFCLGVGNPHHTADCIPSTTTGGSQLVPDTPPVTNTDPGSGTPALILPGNQLPPTDYAVPPQPLGPQAPQLLQIVTPPPIKQRVPQPLRQNPKRPSDPGSAGTAPGNQSPGPAQYAVPPQPAQILVPPLVKQRAPQPTRQKTKPASGPGPAGTTPGAQPMASGQYQVPPFPAAQQTPQPMQILAPPRIKQRAPQPTRQKTKPASGPGLAGTVPGAQSTASGQYQVPPHPAAQQRPQLTQIVAPPLLQQLIPALRPQGASGTPKPGSGASTTVARPLPKPAAHRPMMPAQTRPGAKPRPTATHTPQPAFGHNAHQHVTPKTGRQPAHAIPRFTDAARGGTVDCIASGFRRRFHDDAQGPRVVSGVMPHVEIPDAISRDIPAEKPLHAGCIVKVKRKYRSR